MPKSIGNSDFERHNNPASGTFVVYGPMVSPSIGIMRVFPRQGWYA